MESTSMFHWVSFEFKKIKMCFEIVIVYQRSTFAQQQKYRNKFLIIYCVLKPHWIDVIPWWGVSRLHTLACSLHVHTLHPWTSILILVFLFLACFSNESHFWMTSFSFHDIFVHKMHPIVNRMLTLLKTT